MKKGKNLMASLLVFAFFVSLNPGAFAAAENKAPSLQGKYILEAGVVVDVEDTTVVLSNAETWAYKDYSAATNLDKANILKARSMMMEQTDWAADGFPAYYVAPDGTVEEIPFFSEVFPDWDIEQIWAYKNEVRELSAAKSALSVAAPLEETQAYIPLIAQGPTPRLRYQLRNSDDFSASIPAAVDGVVAPDVFSSNMGPTVMEHRTTVKTLTGPTTCNIGYTVTTPHSTIDTYFKRGVPKDGMMVQLFIDIYTNADTIAVRVSTESTPGKGTFNHSDYWVYPDK